MAPVSNELPCYTVLQNTHFWGAQGVYKEEYISLNIPTLGGGILKIKGNTEVLKTEASNADYKCISILLVAVVNLPHRPRKRHAVFAQLAAELPVGFEELLCILRKKIKKNIV